MCQIIHNNHTPCTCITPNQKALLATFIVTVISTGIGLGIASRVGSSLLQAGLISSGSGLLIGGIGSTCCYWNTKKVVASKPNHIDTTVIEKPRALTPNLPLSPKPYPQPEAEPVKAPEIALPVDQTKPEQLVKRVQVDTSDFFEGDVFKNMVASCTCQSELHALVGLTLAILQLIQKPEDKPIVYNALSQLQLEEFYKEYPDLKKNIKLESNEPEWYNSTRKVYYQFAVRKSFSIIHQICFPTKAEAQLTEADQQLIFERLKSCFCIWFHGTNSFFLRQILKHGMQGAQANEQAEEMAQLASDLESPNLFGFHTNQPKTSYYKTRNPEEAFHYAKGSPEWFQSFLGNSTVDTNPQHYFRYEKRDDKRCQQLFNNMAAQKAQEKKWSVDQHSKFRKFYVDNWQRFGTALPAVIVMQEDRQYFDKWLQVAVDFSHLVNSKDNLVNPKDKMIAALASWFDRDDHATSDKVIAPEALGYYTFPMIKFVESKPVFYTN